MKRKYLALLVMALAAVVVLAACRSDNEPAGVVAAGDAIVHFVTSGAPPNDHDYVLARVNESLAEQGYGFQVEMTFITEFWTNVALMIGAGETIDIANGHMSTLPDLVARGVYQPIEAYFEANAPYLAAVMSDSARAQGSIGGVLYAIPRLIPMAQFNWVMDIRGDLRQEWGFPEIDSIDLLEEFMRRAAAEDMFGMPPINFRSMYAHYANFFFPLGDNAMYPIFIDPKDPTHTVRSFFDTDYFRNVVERRARWIEEDLVIVDSDRFGGNAGQAFNHGMFAVMGGNLLTQSERADGLHGGTPGAFMETITINPTHRYIFQGGDNMLGVGSTSTNVAEAVQMINWIRSSQENYDLWTHGVYGRNYVLTPEGRISFEGIEDDMRHNTRVWMWNDLNRARFSQHLPDVSLERLRNWDEGAIPSPFLGFTVDTSDLRTEFMQIQGIMAEFMPMFEQGLVAYDDIIGEFMNQMWAAGLQRAIDEVQVQLNEFMAGR